MSQRIDNSISLIQLRSVHVTDLSTQKIRTTKDANPARTGVKGGEGPR
jgi:hypothetical protein